jgi:3-hydroxyisobutyrate dehydrogenase-like beta-hydroxyacid dehydrogenase
VHEEEISMVADVRAESPVVGMVGVGDMGYAIATSILKHFQLVAFDLRPEPIAKLVAQGARGGDSISAVADACEILITVVVDDKQVKAVVRELLKHPGRVRTLIVSATVLPDTCIALAEEARAHGIELLDVPVSGGAEKAARGVLTLFIGGEDEAVKRAWPVLSAFGKRLFHIGPVGAGSAGKLVNNLLSMGQYALTLETMRLAALYGITEDKATEFISVSAGDSRVVHTWGRIDRSRRAHTQTGSDSVYETFSKDVQIAAQAAGLRGVTLPIAASIGAIMGDMMKVRDKHLDALGPRDPTPLCTICGQELALPFREEGIHPECGLGLFA